MLMSDYEIELDEDELKAARLKNGEAVFNSRKHSHPADGTWREPGFIPGGIFLTTLVLGVLAFAFFTVNLSHNMPADYMVWAAQLSESLGCFGSDDKTNHAIGISLFLVILLVVTAVLSCIILKYLSVFRTARQHTARLWVMADDDSLAQICADRIRSRANINQDTENMINKIKGKL